MKNVLLVEAEIWTMVRTDKGSAVLIKPLGSERSVPIFIGQLEAQSILIGMGSIELPRPLTHDLFIEMLKEMNIVIDRIEINDLAEGTFFARIIVRQGKKKYSFDSRPSDAIAIAIRVSCPVFIAEYIIDEAGIPISMIGDNDRVSVNRSMLEELQHALAAAVKEENYEDAASIRDRIREIEENGSELDAQPSDAVEDIFNLFDDDDDNSNEDEN